MRSRSSTPRLPRHLLPAAHARRLPRWDFHPQVRCGENHADCSARFDQDVLREDFCTSRVAGNGAFCPRVKGKPPVVDNEKEAPR